MRFVPVVGFLVLVVLLTLMLVARPDAGKQADKPLPVLTLKTLDGKAQWDQGVLAGKVTVINFFASWCTPCIAEMPELMALKKQFPQAQFYGVVWNDDPKTMAGWLKKYSNPFDQVWFDGKGESTIALGIKGIPETLIIDGEGVVRYRQAGPITKALREGEIAEVMATLKEGSHAR
jgi:cytochrome c biogenesis protein CcmG, thiol:disulfide interchange protein DsbE